MKFGAVHRLAIDFLALLGVLAVVGSGALAPLSGLLLLGAMLLALLSGEWLQAHPHLKLVPALSPAALVAVAALRLALTDSLLQAAIEFVTALQVVRVLTRRGAAHDPQIIVLSILQFVIATVVGSGLAFGVCFLLFLTVAPSAMVLSHLRREVEGNYRQGARDRTGLPVDVPRILRSRRVVGRGFMATTLALSLPVFLATALLFLLFPRLGTPIAFLNTNKTGRMVGFSDSVDLGQVGVLRSDPTVALRFRFLGQTEPAATRMILRLRGTAFDTYNGRSWSRSSADRSTVPAQAEYALVRPREEGDRAVDFELEPIDPPVLFLPPRAVALQLPSQPSGSPHAVPLSRGGEGEIRYGDGDGDPQGLRYTVWLGGEHEPRPLIHLGAGERARYLQLPSHYDPRIARTAAEWSDGAHSPLQRAKRIEQHLATQFTYDTASPSGAALDPVADFLYESQRGHCEFFSTAMALMLRTQGIPTRNVTGFVGGTYNRFGRYYVVREGDAHSWLEAFIDQGDGHGSWVTFDPTPTSGAQPLEEVHGAVAYVRDLLEALSQRWNRHVVGYDLKAQSQLWRYLSDSYRGASDAGALHTPGGWLTRRGVLLLLALLVVAAGGVLMWRRQRDDASPPDAAAPGEGHTGAAALRATELYLELESWLAGEGLLRAPHTSPLHVAESLRREGHALAEPVCELTELYLRGRFSSVPLSLDEERHFEAVLHQLKTQLAAPSR